VACGSASLRSFFELRSVPTQDGVLWQSAEEARSAPVGDIDLRLCEVCGYIGNVRYDPLLVRFVGYDVSLDHSPSFQRFLDGLCKGLVEKYSLCDRTVIDIGCGTGRFLRTLCKLGDNHGVGFDPSWSGEPRETTGGGIEFIAEAYSERQLCREAHLISFRHVLDIVDRPDALLALVRRAALGNPETVLYCEVPNALRTFDDLIVWNVVYEHRSWFTAASLSNFFERSGFAVLEAAPCWQGEYVGLEARVAEPHVRALDRAAHDRISSSIDRFGAAFTTVVEECRARLDEVEQSGRTVAAWGAGARAITFFALYPEAARLVPTIVDINRKRQGLYLPRTAHQVGAPEQLADLQPDTILITNPTYEAEIVAQTRELGLNSDFWVL
jgi:hypothetical protein